jgi:hypothetical protein
MRRSYLSLLTAILSLLGGLAGRTLGNSVSGLVWVTISIGWLLAAIVQLREPDPIEPFPAPRLFRRFSRLILFWS